MHPPTSPSTVQASPSSTPHPAYVPNGAPTAAATAPATATQVRSSDTPKARARLACMSCRRSKIRCGPTTGEIVRPCPQCLKSGKACIWPDDPNAPIDPPVKKTDPAAHDVAADHRLSEPRKRKKPPTGAYGGLSPADDDATNLKNITEVMWKELFTIFSHHKATELPFLHGPTFLKDLNRLDGHVSPYFGSLRFAFLALTVPFHDGFRRATGQDPLRIARLFAARAEAAINFNAMASPTIEIPQALLMLSLHAHGEGSGGKSFILLGNAIKAMQLLGCQFDQELVDRKKDDKKRSTSKKGPQEDWMNERRFIMEETKRRTFWACFIVDRYISSGDYKPPSIIMNDPLVLVQLPCREERFEMGLKTKTRKLWEPDQDFSARREQYYQDLKDYQHGIETYHHSYPMDADVEWEDEDAQSPLVWLIKALDIYGGVMRYTCTVTRRADPDHPWNVKSKFKLLDSKVDRLISTLPASLKLTPTVREVHIHHQRATPYVLLHSASVMCKIALHREFFPYITEPKSFPQGPTDGPNWERLQKACELECPNFWKDSARTFFKATRDGLDLLRTCKERGALVESPLTAWVCFSVTFSIMWLAFFPNFDQDGVLCQGTGRPDELVVRNFEDAFAILRHLQERLVLARVFSKRLRSLFDSLMNFKSQYYNPDSPAEIKVSHGLKKYLEVEKDHKEFGADVSETDDALLEEVPELRILLRAYDPDQSLGEDHPSPNEPKGEVKSESATPIERVPEVRTAFPETTFTAVNHNRAAVAMQMSPPQPHGPPSQQHPYATLNQPSSYGAAPNFQPQQQLPTPTYNNYDGQAGVVSSSMGPHTHHSGYIPATNDTFLEAPSSGLQSNYPLIPWDQMVYYNQSEWSNQDVQVFVGNNNSFPENYIPPGFFDGTQGS